MQTRLTDTMQAIRIQRAWKKVPKSMAILQQYIDVGPLKLVVGAMR